MNYNNLAPGWYLQRGDEIKSLSSLDRLLGDMETSPDALAERISWSYIALEKRRAVLEEIETEWMANNDVIDQPPFRFDISAEVGRIDAALQLTGQAYYLKVRNGRGRLVELRWLDPSTMEPDYSPAGIIRYKRTINSGVMYLPADDVLRIWVRGIAEQAPGITAGNVTRAAAQVLYHLTNTQSNVFANNALPVMLLRVPAGTPEPEKERLRGFFDRMLNRRTGNPINRVVPVTQGVEATQLSVAPKDLAMSDVYNMARDEILAAHGVPLSQVIDSAANYATANERRRSFISLLGGRYKLIYTTINNDPDVMRAGVALYAYQERHADMQQDEQAVSTAFLNYAQHFSAEAAAYLVGITRDDFPADIAIWRETPKPAEPDVEPVRVEQIDLPDATRAALLDLGKWQSKTARGAFDFVSDFIPAKIADTLSAALSSIGDDPQAIKSAFADARRAIVAPDQERDEIEQLVKALDLTVRAMQLGGENRTPVPNYNLTIHNAPGEPPVVENVVNVPETK